MRSEIQRQKQKSTPIHREVISSISGSAILLFYILKNMHKQKIGCKPSYNDNDNDCTAVIKDDDDLIQFNS